MRGGRGRGGGRGRRLGECLGGSGAASTAEVVVHKEPCTVGMV